MGTSDTQLNGSYFDLLNEKYPDLAPEPDRQLPERPAQKQRRGRRTLAPVVLFIAVSGGVAWSIVALRPGPAAKPPAAPSQAAPSPVVELANPSPLPSPKEVDGAKPAIAEPTPAVAEPTPTDSRSVSDGNRTHVETAQQQPESVRQLIQTRTAEPEAPEVAPAAEVTPSPAEVTPPSAEVAPTDAPLAAIDTPTATAETTLPTATRVPKQEQPVRKLHSPPPEYPASARLAGVTGTVVVEAQIDATGQVASTRIIRGRSDALDRAAAQALEGWRFEPATRDGQPIASSYRISFEFALDPAAKLPPVEVGGDVLPPRRLQSPLPPYPNAAWAEGITGDVLVRAVIDETGAVADIEVLKGLPYGMTEAAVEAIERWTFHPATRHGKPVAVYRKLSVRFEN